MDLYEAWQRKRFRKFKTGSDPFRAAGALKDEPRITQEDVVVEDNMFRAHELHPVGSPEYKKVKRLTACFVATRAVLPKFRPSRLER